jgi:hypothetical protein
MSWWDRALNGGQEAPPSRPVSTPTPGPATWYPTPQYSPPQQDPWAQAPVDPVQQASIEISDDVLRLMDDGDGTWSYEGDSSVAPSMRLNTNVPDAVDSSMSMHERHEVMWKRAAMAPLRGKSKALKAEPDRCPACGDARYFTRRINSQYGKAPRPICMACSYTGDNYSISELNQA